MGVSMGRVWDGVKRFVNWCVISSLCWWVLVWLIGSYQAGRVLGVDDLIPTADRWLAVWGC
jgi:hypothetical protein